MVLDASPALVRIQRKLLKAFLILLFGYPIYLLLIGGPVWALEGRGILNFVPEPVRKVCYIPTAPICLIPHLRGRYADYMDWWYLDPDAGDRETGWD